MARRSYNEVAATVGSGSEQPTLPPNPHVCAAHGCPIAGTIVIEDRRGCFVHARVAQRAQWDGVTARIRNRTALVEASRYLRISPEYRERVLIDHALAMLPTAYAEMIDGNARRSRYALLTAVESLLITECAPTDEPALVQDAWQRARDVARDLALLRSPAVREPGEDGA